jgi:hypothetical protein
MARYLVIDGERVVQNAIEWDGETPFELPEGMTVERSDESDIGEVFPPQGPA